MVHSSRYKRSHFVLITALLRLVTSKEFCAETFLDVDLKPLNCTVFCRCAINENYLGCSKTCCCAGLAVTYAKYTTVKTLLKSIEFPDKATPFTASELPSESITDLNVSTKLTISEGSSFNTDVVFAMDLSSSSNDILQKQKKIIRSLTEYLLPSTSNELGLITYSDLSNIDSELSPKFNNKILDKIENNGRRQNVSSAITVASDNIFKKRNNDEKLKNKQRVLALFVVGKPSSSNPQAVPERYGKLLQKNNVLTVIIGFDEVGNDFNKNMPGSKLLKYSEDKTLNELKELMQGWHDIGINKNVTMPQRTNKYGAGFGVYIGISLIIIIMGVFVALYFFFKKHQGQGNQVQYEHDSGFVEQKIPLALPNSSDQDPVNRNSFSSV
ncbi:uncharacterized protein LOC105846899 isoform X2 [Hydra vulgaris]|uniref:uncharacterized protein LOC105846899 isoform X2 n=1 Tax=Hydra vulgaris TaxID=6087 RepID=UPI001F5EDED8|nr:uncharacterized protein LOC105846899 isoform X2 [Hydra vulgaris]